MRADRTPADPAGFAPARLLFDAPGIRDFDVAHRSDRLIALMPIASGERPIVSAIWNWTSVAEPSSTSK
jgi:hypothetical protein